MKERRYISKEPIWGAAYSTPLGVIAATASANGVRSVGFDLSVLHDTIQDDILPLQGLRAWLDAYLARAFEDLPEVPMDFVGSPFEISAWKAMLAVGPGRTFSYGDLAKTVGRTGQARAVAAAVGRNPLLLLVPCHRVIAASGGLHGFSAGIERKAWLLRHEGVLLL
jgi:methylated-DNA-[protein]-cysteine S-methyltransferase